MISLWEKDIPGFDLTIGQKEPGITPYPVKSAKPCPAVIVCPGGGYWLKAPHEGEPIAHWLNSIGIYSFVLDYRVAPYKHPYPLLDAQRAIRLVRHKAGELNIAPDKIGILGFSAGGHLASAAATHFDYGNAGADDPVEKASSRPDAAVLCYPVISFGEYRHDGSMVNLLGEKPDEKLRLSLSNETRVTKDTPPAFLWHTADDDTVPAENSIMFAQALSKNKVPLDLHIFASGVHGLGLAEDNPEIAIWTKLCENWFEKIGFI